MQSAAQCSPCCASLHSRLVTEAPYALKYNINPYKEVYNELPVYN